MDLDQSPSSKHQAVRGKTAEPQEFVHHPMLDTWVATRSILFSSFLLKTLWNFSAFQLNKKNSNRVNSSLFLGCLFTGCMLKPTILRGLVGWSGGPKQPRSPTNLGTRGSRRPAAASAQYVWEAGDTRRPGGLCRAAGAQGWGVESQKRGNLSDSCLGKRGVKVERWEMNGI